MPYNPFDPPFEDLPEVIPIFPLEGALLLPRGELPLNIFEPRYLAMVADALKTNRLIGIIQPDFKTGCVGRIVRFEEEQDGRYLISLRGLCRFKLGMDITAPTLAYRRARVSWQEFAKDMVRMDCLGIDKGHLKNLLRQYFDSQGLSMDWELMDEVADEGLFTALAMVCPLPASEKQALLEASCCKARADLFIKLLEMALQSGAHSPPARHH
ncbi:MAG TPA: peptidase S16 [Rhodospirillaceae bacterium]|nr:peptidase S16 [Rhodospirillaceae bacterium]